MSGLEIVNVEQGSSEWFHVRLGIPTASQFHAAVANRTKADSKTRTTYMRKLAGEIITGQPVEEIDIKNFRRGHEHEPRAAALYQMGTRLPTTKVGFMKRGRLGASPDRMVLAHGGLEIKSAAAHLQIGVLLADEIPPEHWLQVLGCLLVSGREWWDFMSFCPGLPPLIKRTSRASVSSELAELRIDLDQFVGELDELVETIRRIGK